MTEKDEPIHEHLQNIMTAGLRARDLAHQILTFSRKDERKLSPLQAGPLVKESLKLMRSSLPSTIEISQEIDEYTDNVLADPTQIHQIVMNLCANAAHAMEADGGKLKVSLSQVTLSEQDIRLHPDLRPGDYLKLSVQDTGYGISPENMKRIFDPYFTTKETNKGTGLGLAVTHGIVKSYGGAIYVYSEQNVGATFNVYIPTIKKQAAIDHEAPAYLPRGNEHILLVDDEPALLDVGRRLLERLGYRVSIANGGESALELFRQDPNAIDLVLTDMTMPKMTGDKLALELLTTRRDLPIILSTGYGFTMTSEKALSIGVKAFIQKPILEADLARIIREVFDVR